MENNYFRVLLLFLLVAVVAVQAAHNRRGRTYKNKMTGMGKGRYTCKPIYGKCMYLEKEKICNGVKDCPRGDDEINCPPVPVRCASGKHSCHNSSTCGTKCDGITDCPMEDDESDCMEPPVRCASGQHSCKDEVTCSAECDGGDCPGNDENTCTDRCTGKFKCSNGSCATPCDEHNECIGAEDEAGCAVRCNKSQILCGDHKTCVQRFEDCPEAPCRRSTVLNEVTVFDTFEECGNCFGSGGGRCVEFESSKFRCECCRNFRTCGPTCEGTITYNFGCSTGAIWDICNGNVLCQDGKADERFCVSTVVRPDEVFINPLMKCNGEDILGGTVELNKIGDGCVDCPGSQDEDPTAEIYILKAFCLFF